MSKTLEKAIKEARLQPDHVQDALGQMLESAIADPMFNADVDAAEADRRDRKTLPGLAEPLHDEGMEEADARTRMESFLQDLKQ